MTQFLRPTKIGPTQKRQPWLLKGSWGERTLPPMSSVDLYDLLHHELIESGQLARDSLSPSNKYHSIVTESINRPSWIENKCVRD
jgi:hypothetical protein